jgi:hypothetical protein
MQLALTKLRQGNSVQRLFSCAVMIFECCGKTAWGEGATDSDLHAINQAMEKCPRTRASISEVIPAPNQVNQIVLSPLKSPEFGTRKIRH